MLSFLIAGHDTTALQIASIIVEVTRHPLVLQRLQQELDTVNPNRSLSSFNQTHLPKLEYLSWIINETMRLQPVASGASRLAEKDFQVNGYLIPKGSNLVISYIAMSRNAPIQVVL